MCGGRNKQNRLVWMVRRSPVSCLLLWLWNEIKRWPLLFDLKPVQKKNQHETISTFIPKFISKFIQMGFMCGLSPFLACRLPSLSHFHTPHFEIIRDDLGIWKNAMYTPRKVQHKWQWAASSSFRRPWYWSDYFNSRFFPLKKIDLKMIIINRSLNFPAPNISLSKCHVHKINIKIWDANQFGFNNSSATITGLQWATGKIISQPDHPIRADAACVDEFEAVHLQLNIFVRWHS